MEQCDYNAPAFDFRLSGVTSISVDLHKYAYCPVGSSAILYREQNLLQLQCFSDVYWAGGIYVSPTLSGSRPGSLIALTWSTLLWNGRLGYVEHTQRILDAVQLLREKLEENNHIEIIGNPLLSSIIFRTKNSRVHVYILGELLAELGWNLSFIQKPEA
jgi:sphinganine-1-phosphate aldolase